MLGGTVDDIPASDPQLRRAYARCRALQRRHDPVFAIATALLPRPTRPGVHALYGFVRGADELVDGPDAATRPDDRRCALDIWEATLRDGLADGHCDHPVIAALVDAGPRYDLPLDQLGAYMDSMRVDCGRVRIADRAQLDRYMDGSAASVGRIMTPLLRAPAALRDDIAAVGVAFQLTNFLRDLHEDWTLDRIYLPDVPEEDLRRGLATAELREAVAGGVARARALFARTAHVTAALPAGMRPGVRLARVSYGRVLSRLEARGYDPFPRSRGAAGRRAVAPS